MTDSSANLSELLNRVANLFIENKPVSDDDDNSATRSTEATVSFEDVLPDITLEQTADPSSVPETGEDVNFTITVRNNSPEAATLDSLSDNVFGDLNDKGTCGSFCHQATKVLGFFSGTFERFRLFINLLKSFASLCLSGTPGFSPARRGLTDTVASAQC